jgi:N-acetylglucosaminyl-diphospho-decaprenol L-rhamnosyltransferase
VTVAVVSFNTRELLLRCLRSLAHEVDTGVAQVYVVDNDSTDGSLQAARALAPWANVVAAGSNIGFGSAVNSVARRTGGEWLLAANADIALKPGALAALLRAGTQERVGCVAPRLVLPDGTTEHSVHPFPTVPFTLAFNLGLHRLSGLGAERLCLEGFWDPERPRSVPWAMGACLLLRRAAFEEVGGFDERQWMYAEDLDLCWRLHAAGWSTRYEPRAVVLHESGAAAAPAFGSARTSRFLTATYELIERRRGVWRMRAIAAINIVGAGLRLAWMAPLSVGWRRWRGPRGDSRRWLTAHLFAVRELTRANRAAQAGRRR